MKILLLGFLVIALLAVVMCAGLLNDDEPDGMA